MSSFYFFSLFTDLFPLVVHPPQPFPARLSLGQVPTFLPSPSGFSSHANLLLLCHLTLLPVFSPAVCPLHLPPLCLYSLLGSQAYCDISIIPEQGPCLSLELQAFEVSLLETVPVSPGAGESRCLTRGNLTSQPPFFACSVKDAFRDSNWIHRA